MLYRHDSVVRVRGEGARAVGVVCLRSHPCRGYRRCNTRRLASIRLLTILLHAKAGKRGSLQLTRGVLRPPFNSRKLLDVPR